MLERMISGLFGRTSTQERAPDDVDALVAEYQSPESTKALLEFGRGLLAANAERIAAIDSKATALAGYSAAVLAFMVTRGTSLAGGPLWRNFFLLLAGLCAVAACVNAGLAVRSARNWQSMGEATWFPPDRATVDGPDKRGRWYLRAMHESLQRNHRITNQKASETIRAQVAVAAAAVFLALSLIGDSLMALILAGGADAQRVDYSPEPLDLTGQYFISVEPRDHVGDGLPPPPPPSSMRLGASLFWGLGGERHGWPELNQQLREYQAHGVDFVRTLIHLRTRGDDDSNPWFHIGLHAEDADLESLIQRYSDRVARHGMKVEWTLLGGTGDMHRGDQQDRFVDRVSNALRGRLAAVEFFEVMNEYGINGGSIPMLHRMAQRLRANLGDSFILALSSPNSVHQGAFTREIQDEVRAMALHEANAITPHHRRDTNEVPDLGEFAPDFVISNEPIGPSSSGRETDKPADIERDWRAAEAAGYYAYVLHSDSGVWSTRITNQYKDGTRGKWPVFSTHTNGSAILATVKRLRSGGSTVTPPPAGDFVEWLEPGQALLSGKKDRQPALAALLNDVQRLCVGSCRSRHAARC